MAEIEEVSDLTHYRERYENGDGVALLAATILCCYCNLRLPKWALLGLAGAFADWEAEPNRTLNSCLGLKKGRHTRELTRLTDYANQQRIVAAVYRVKADGVKGERVFKKAEELLSRIRSSYEAGSLKSTFYKCRTKFSAIGPDTSINDLDKLLRPVCRRRL